MQDNTSQPASGSDRFGPQRGQVGYVQRQPNYYSSGQTLPAAGPTLNQASAAAQRIVDPTPVQPSPPPPRRVVNYGGSFDMLPPMPTPARIEQMQPVSAPQPPAQVQESVFSSSQQQQQPFQVQPEPTQLDTSASQFAQPGSSSQWQSLPTDLPAPQVAANEEEPEQPKTQGGLKLRLPKVTTPKVLVGMAVMLFIAGGVVSFMGLRTNKDVQAQVKSVSKTQNTKDKEGGMTDGLPDEDGNPPSVEYFRTAASYPRVIRIAKTNTEARVLALSIANSGALKAPGNIFDAGWYKDSARPGEAGAMVVDGHVSGATKPGVFKNLSKLARGDKIEIERGDGEVFNYTVQATKTFDADKLEMSSVMVPYVPGKPGLNIITCGGKFDRTTSTYEQRTVVYAVIE